tara:strand:- start:935 stop:1588 length:654 start_codon:yes stop_codon:yes gene_type:complete
MFNFPFQTEAPTFDEWNLAAYRKLSSYWVGFSDADNCGELPTDYKCLNGLIWSVFSVIDEEFDFDFDDDVLMHTGELNPFRYGSCNNVVMSGYAKKQFNEKYGHNLHCQHYWAVEMFNTLREDWGGEVLVAKIHNGKFALWDDTYECQKCKVLAFECSDLVNNDAQEVCYECQNKAATVFQKIHRGNETRWTNPTAVWLYTQKLCDGGCGGCVGCCR